MKYLKTCLLLACMFATLAHADTRVNVVGLFSNKAVLSINGAPPKTLSVGQSAGEVKLLAADSVSASLMIDGKRQVLQMGQAISVGASTQAADDDGSGIGPVTLFADPIGHFHGNLSINGVSLKYVVDTGASTLAMNSEDAKRARIDYEKGQRALVSTANGTANAYYVKVNTLRIGTIIMHNVDVGVLEGRSPETVLLGMNVLNRMDMKRENSVLTLTKKY